MTGRSKTAVPRRLPIAREGARLIAAALLVAAGLWLLAPPVLAAGGSVLALFVLAFFRDPERRIPPGEHRVVAPADGKVIAVDAVEDDRFLRAPVTKVSIFMSPLNVHVNRNPVGGTVERVQYHPGKYFRAFAEKASLDNEQNAVVVRDPSGRRVCFVQIAGFLARRIVCYLRESMQIQRGERCGIILFGSRVDVYLPAEAVVRVELGRRVRAGETVLAEWPR